MKIGFFRKFCSLSHEVGRYRQLISRYRQLMELCVRVIKVNVISWTKVIYTLNLKLNFLRNHVTNQSQFLCVVSLGRSKYCITGPSHMTKMATMPISDLNFNKSLEPVD